ncbi:MAG: ABC transporter substrate-binding protein [Piscinibacter sp.]|uniref:ABC transporter substrate-binding protein n=1 Tax=Piscinibacter TaxID=1114981 RepID=UPI000FDDA91C|nr:MULTISPECIES: ABC transporter substrate-binding protein [Piscinibacter]MCW5663917.1 ABC transporter substrate-binding protein [Piscinibacter sp.]
MPGLLETWRARAAVLLIALLAACNNSPYPDGAAATNTLFNSFDERSPRYLDPTASYSNPETPYTYTAYEPLYAYHYLKRPYELIPKTAEAVAQPHYLDAAGNRLPPDAPAEQIAHSVYDIRIKKGILYAPHPAFAKNDKGEYLYHHLTRAQVGDKRSPWEFDKQGTRELVAEDYVYAFKRHATTRIEAPIFAIFSEYLVGLKEYAERVKTEDAKLLAGLSQSSPDKPFLDFRQWPLEGAQALDSHTLRLRIKGKYPQWKYWLAMTFTAPVPWEADAFYAQPGMNENGLSLVKWPVGTGPYMMTEYVQDRRHVMKRNPNYRGEPYPCEGEPGDKEKGLLEDCGKTMPFIDTIVSTIVKERVPRKELFKQGYLDVPEIERPEWGVDFRVDMEDSDRVRQFYEQRGYSFPQTTDINNWYLGFNWLDPVVGKGDTPERQAKNRKLRQALSIAIDWEEGYGKIFRTKAGLAAHGPVPPGVFGSREGTPEGFNPVTHRKEGDQIVRRPLDEAKKLLAEAGYPDGRDAATGKPLVLNYDYQRTPTPEIKAELDWMVKQFGKLGVQLEIRATDYNQFQDKMLKGKQQIFWWGWLADYPDAENFLFLLYGPNAKYPTQGENAANYSNPEYDRLYRQMQTMDDGPEKQKVIDQMVAIVREDAPWAWGYWPYVALAFQPWAHNGKPTIVVRDLAKYYRVDPAMRVAKQSEWNHPVRWPLVLIALALLALAAVAWRSYRARQRATARPARLSPSGA